MTITNVNIHNIFTEGKLKAVASIVIDNFIEIHDIKVVQGTDRLFVGMPSRKTVDGGFADMVQAEYDDFIAEMKGKSADEIIESVYQIVIKDEITVFCRDCSPKLTARQFEALLSSKNTLHEVFEQWCKNGELHGLVDIIIAIEEAADRILVSLGQ